MNGVELFEKVFAEEIETNGDLDLSEIEDVKGVEDYEEEIYSNEGWYNYHSVIFKYNGKHYNFEYRRHTADNVCDSHWDIESFSEVELEDDDSANINLETLKQIMFGIKDNDYPKSKQIQQFIEDVIEHFEDDRIRQ